ncbi:MAG TPA: hypothetical protein VFB50_05600 [Chloroflexota bacterium]|nr:hypothetical protein [Chloroflexota bacterium]
MTATEPKPETGLAVREFSDQQIRARLDVAAAAGFGLVNATPEQLQGIYLLAVKYDVDPLSDITLYQGRPWWTIDGRVRLMRRHPEFAGYATRPLSREEKEAWMYAADEVVVECTIRTKRWGEISARGKVTPSEFSRQPVAKSHPQEMAEKRAIARASRMAFGTDMPDEDDLDLVIQQRDDRQRSAQLAATYSRVFDGAYDLKETPTAKPYTPTDVREVEDRDLVRSDTDPLWKRDQELIEQARGLGLNPKPLALPVDRQQLQSRVEKLSAAVAERQSRQEQEDAQRAREAAGG